MISLGAGEELVSEYRSCIYYHNGKPEWSETIKVGVIKSIVSALDITGLGTTESF